MKESIYNSVVARPSLPIASRAANATVNGSSVDRGELKNNFRSVGVVVHAGTITDGSHAITLQESDDNATWSDVAAEHLQGALPTIEAADDDKVFEFGYLGHKRYVRVVVTTTVPATPTGGVFGALVLLGQARRTVIRA
jgi:hypothetical protein